MLKIIAIFVAVAAATILAYAASRPDDFRVARSLRISAPPEKIFPHINDLRAFDAWNPFAKQDPTIRSAYSGPQSGPGAVSSWDSSGSAGKGTLTITDATEPSKVAMKLDMVKPIDGHNDILFTLQPADGGTDVTWAMTGKTPFIGKVIQVFCSMDRMVGGAFETGLADLKAVAER